jgi:C-terminal processing protease CtpA/Prc
MSNPRHLWSGDWELDSASAREELARRRAEAGEQATETPVAPAPPTRDRRAPSPPQQQPRAAARRPSTAELGARALAALTTELKGARHALAARTARARRLRIALAVALVGLVSAGAAYAVTTMLVNSSTSSSTIKRPDVWLGINVTGSPLGVLVTTVLPGGPAGKAGLQPGDLITSINNQPVGTVDAVNAALAGLHSGNTVPIQYSRGLVTYTIQATLATRPPGSP